MTTAPEAATQTARYRIGLLGVFALAVLARSLDYERVLLPDGEVIFAAGDAFYHARRALYSFLEFPELLRFDPCINFPDGALVPHPPLLDWVTAGTARLLGRDVATFEHVAAWAPVFLTSATVLPIAALGRWAAGRSLGLLAAAIFALLPICVNYGQLGNFDHHALAGLLGGCLVVLFVKAFTAGDAERPGYNAKYLALVMAGLVAVRLLMMLTWTGNLLYLLPGDIALVLAAAYGRSQTQIRALGLSAAATAMFTWGAVVFVHPESSTSYRAVELSLLHVLIYASCSVLCAAQYFAAAHKPVATGREAVVRLLGCAVPIAFAALLVPGVFDGLMTAIEFLGANDGYTETVVEQLPVFWGNGQLSLAIAHERMGLFVYMIPFTPFAFVRIARGEGMQFAARFLAGWVLLFGFLAVQQVRYVHDFAPAGCVAFALLLQWVAGRASVLVDLLPRHALVPWAMAGVLIAPTLPSFYLPVARLAVHGLQGDLAGIDRGLLSVAGTQLRFAQLVRAATDSTGTCQPGAGEAPTYGVLAHVGLGHALHYTAKRATPADPFGPYIGRENFAAVAEFMESTNEGQAAKIMKRLSAKYVATAADTAQRSPGTLAHRLHENDGSFVNASPQLGRFRLVTEGPLGGMAMSEVFGDEAEGKAPYKLFEFVPGATIELRTEPGAQVTAELALRTPLGRRFVYRVASRADASGRARLRVPYANPARRKLQQDARATKRVQALGAYRVRAKERTFQVFLSEDDIQSRARVEAAPFEIL